MRPERGKLLERQSGGLSAKMRRRRQSRRLRGRERKEGDGGKRLLLSPTGQGRQGGQPGRRNSLRVPSVACVCACKSNALHANEPRGRTENGSSERRKKRGMEIPFSDIKMKVFFPASLSAFWPRGLIHAALPRVPCT